MLQQRSNNQNKPWKGNNDNKPFVGYIKDGPLKNVVVKMGKPLASQFCELLKARVTHVSLQGQPHIVEILTDFKNDKTEDDKVFQVANPNSVT